VVRRGRCRDGATPVRCPTCRPTQREAATDAEEKVREPGRAAALGGLVEVKRGPRDGE
jgi:hypothetical protein